MMHIAIIDDDQVNHYILQKMIGRTGRNVYIWDMLDGLIAIEHIRDAPAREPPSLFFLDINMQQMDGWQFLGILSSLPQNHMLLESVDTYPVLTYPVG